MYLFETSQPTLYKMYIYELLLLSLLILLEAMFAIRVE